MITTKSEAKELITKYQNIFDLIIGKRCTLSFDMHTIPGVTVTGIELGKTTGMKNAPEKRTIDGKNKSPMIFNILTDQGDSTDEGKLTFVLDDTLVTPLGNGVRLTVALEKPLGDKKDIVVELRLEK